MKNTAVQSISAGNEGNINTTQVQLEKVMSVESGNGVIDKAIAVFGTFGATTDETNALKSGENKHNNNM